MTTTMTTTTTTTTTDHELHPPRRRHPQGFGGVYVMNADGTGPTRLTTNPAIDVSPHW
jgi:hypothetical protein